MERKNTSKGNIKHHSIKRKKKNAKEKYKNINQTNKKTIQKKQIHKNTSEVNAKMKPQDHIHKKNENKYSITVDNAKVDILIEKQEKGHIYTLLIPEISTGTEALLSHIRNELITITTLGVGEIVDQKSINIIKQRFMNDAKRILREKMPTIQKETEDLLIGLLMQEMLGLGKVEFLINDPLLEEIVIIGSKEPVRVFHKNYGWLLTNIQLNSEDEILNFSNIIARRIGRQISILSPLLDAHVVTGDRANAVLYPISTKGHTITIRKFARDPWTIIDLIQNNTIGIDMAALLWLAFEFEMNVLISGGTGSGKTVFLNACMPFIPPNHRIISMEDTRELMLPDFLYWCPLVTRSPNAEGKGEVSMLDLLINSLRMRPDRIVLGEIRRQREAEVLFEAMHTGHSVYATLHADSASETIRRLTNPPINIPPSMLGSVHLNIVMYRDRRKGRRRALHIAEFMSGKDNISANIIYRWVPETDEFTQHNKSMVFFDTLSRHTGMSQTDVEENLNHKKSILEWLIKNNIRDLQSIGKVMNTYYTNPEELNTIIKHNKIEKIIIKKKEKKDISTDTEKENTESEIKKPSDQQKKDINETKKKQEDIKTKEKGTFFHKLMGTKKQKEKPEDINTKKTTEQKKSENINIEKTVEQEKAGDTNAEKMVEREKAEDTNAEKTAKQKKSENINIEKTTEQEKREDTNAEKGAT